MTITEGMLRHAFNLLYPPSAMSLGRSVVISTYIKNRRKSANDVLYPVKIHQFHMSK